MHVVLIGILGRDREIPDNPDLVDTHASGKTWDGCDDGGSPVSAGMYYARLETVDRKLTRVIAYRR